MNGTDKRKLLVIEQPQKPQCFKNIKNLPFEYVTIKRHG
jgi:hypothetical protein